MRGWSFTAPAHHRQFGAAAPDRSRDGHGGLCIVCPSDIGPSHSPNYWGLVLSTQALISPVLYAPDFPSYEFLGFWAIHLLVVWAAIYLTFGRGMRPRWHSYRIAVITTLVWAAVTFTFNTIAGTNYGFLNRNPATPTLLDVLGRWPVYLLTGGILILIVWALMTWPWERQRQHKGKQLH